MRAYLRKDAEIARVAVTDYPARGAQEIVTAYRVLEAGEQSRLEVELITGRTHQIRAHLAHIGHPILGDDKYGDRALNRRLGLRRPLPVVASTEPPRSHSLIAVEADFKRSSYGTLAAVPATFGIFMAARVIRKLSRL